MAITLVSGGALGVAANNGTNVTIALPTLVSNDVVVSFGGHFNRAGSNTGPTATGWTPILSNVTASPFFVAAYKVMGGTPDTSFVAYGTGNVTDAAAYGLYCLRGVATTAVVGSAANFARATSTNPDSPAATSTVSNAWMLSLAMSVVNDASTTLPTNYTITVAANVNDTNPATVGGGVLEIAVPGAENPGAFGSWGSGAWLALSVFINPFIPTANSATVTLAGAAGASAIGTAKAAHAAPLIVLS